MKHILIIEDEILIAQSLKRLLEKKGHLVDCTESGHDAIHKIFQTNYDRILCDLMLQDISGFDVIEESKKRYSTRDISEKFLIMTAYNSPQVLEKASQYNCKILNKPFTSLADALTMIEQGRTDGI